MAKQQEDVKKRTVLVPVDGSEHSERAFDCEYIGVFRDSQCIIDLFGLGTVIFFGRSILFP